MLSIGFQAPIPRVGGTLDGKPKGVRVSATRGVPTLNNDFTGLCQRSPVFSSGCRQFFFGSPRSQSGESHLAATARCGPDARFIDRAWSSSSGRRRTPRSIPVAGPRLRGSSLGSVPVGNSKTTAIPLILPSVQAMALAQFVKRVDFETTARFAAVTVVCDGKSEADLIWLALIALRRALAKAGVAPR